MRPNALELEQLKYRRLIAAVSDFLGTLTETEGYVEGEWDEYELLMDILDEDTE